ncbi:hypothetical protein Hamer_G009760 [Homarus americanus]|uniref:Uncharacterized protein n=1 Tax=Homarus americanus TaxID=6706 RepID=A0A8J5N9X7_HOMAM|nr:hypothetical protein Hamer_G009760 [Homarus americanus]
MSVSSLPVIIITASITVNDILTIQLTRFVEDAIVWESFVGHGRFSSILQGLVIILATQVEARYYRGFKGMFYTPSQHPARPTDPHNGASYLWWGGSLLLLLIQAKKSYPRRLYAKMDVSLIER